MNKNKTNISTVIKDRLKLQTNQNALYRDFQIKSPDFETVTSPGMLSRVLLWDNDKRKKFYIILGGPKFLPLTSEFFSNLIKTEFSPGTHSVSTAQTNHFIVKNNRFVSK